MNILSSLLDPVALLKALVACPSITPETAGVLEIVAAALVPLGFTVTRLRFEGDGSYPVDNLFATRGTGGRRLLFAGHTDVVPSGDRALWTSDPFVPTERDGKLFGRGTADMKSGVACFIAAVSRAVANGTADGGTIQFAITNDEEADGVNGTEKLMAWAEANGHAFDFAIVGEPSATARVGDSIKIGRRGSLSGTITVAGRQGHVAYPHRAINPIPVAAALVTALAGQLDDGTEHFPPSNLEFTSIDVGNPTGNVIPAAATLRFNVRYNDGWTPERLTAAIRDVIANVDDNGASIAFTPAGKASRAFLSPLGGAVEMLNAVIADITGTPAELSTAGGTSDARFIAQYGPVVECGLPGQTMHQADEHVAISDVADLTALYAGFIGRYFSTTD
ncbi:MAG: succinyl-diaminopimelate desuccinylase [Devosia sp.]|nr:succinyl-diaminopimelate desuccinylase [Devosia sp.]